MKTSSLLFFALAVSGFAHAGVEKDVETVMNAFMPIATDMLEKHGQIFPYGGAMTTDDKLVKVSSYEGNKSRNSSAALSGLREAFHAGAGADMYTATALFYGVRVKRPDTGTRTNAIAVALDHEDDYSVIVFFPYTVVKGKVKLDAAFSTPGANAVFGK